MRNIPALVLCLVAFAVSSPSRAASNCTDAQVIQKVCVLSDGDDTGFSKRLTDFGNVLVDGTSRGTRLSDEGYAKFQRVFSHVTAAYRKVFEQMSGSDRDYFLYRLSDLRIPTRAQIEPNALLAMLYGPNAEYEWNSDEVVIYPIILNYPGLSETELEMILAHEIGHFLDPDASTLRPLPLVRSSERAQVIDGAKCYQRDFVDSAGATRHITNEDFADWMASSVARYFIEDAPSNEMRTARARSIGYFFCESDNPLQKLENQLARIGDPHAKNSERILTLVRNPEVLKSLGCGPMIVRSGTGASLGSCMLPDNASP